MPAVNPARLRFQMEGLMAFFASPVEFHRHLQDLFSLYANRALRFGDATEVKPLIPMYRLPAPVIRQLQLDLRPRVNADPVSALLLADELWLDPYYEVKQTAVSILGMAPITFPQPVMDRLTVWLSPDLDTKLISELFSTGTLQLQQAYPEVWESFIKPYLEEEDPELLTLGIKALTEGIKNPEFTNLPAVFRLISPILHHPDRKLLRDLAALIEVLAKLSPTETGFFLRQILSLSNSPETERLVKQCLPFFPEPIATELKFILRR